MAKRKQAKKKIRLEVPEGLELYPYQRKDCRFFVRKKRGCNFSEMGTGKSPICVVWANTLPAQKVLVIVPAIMRLTMEEEFLKWSTRDYVVETAYKLPDRPTAETTIYIVSYNWVTHLKNLRFIKKWGFDTLIVDEFHNCKSIRAKRSKAVVHDVMRLDTLENIMCMTGTPITRTAGDYYNQIKTFIPKMVLGTYTDFRNKFMYKRHNGFGIEYYGARNEEVLQEICKPFVRRRLKKDVLKDLPPKILKNVYVSIPKALAKKSLDYVDHAMNQITGIRSKDIVLDDNYVATMKRELGLAKVRSSVEYIQTVLEEKDCLVIFAYHIDVIKILKKCLLEKKVDCRSITGSTSDKNRQKYVRDFQAGNLPVLILNIVAGGVGITLTRADHAVFCELDWSFATVNQAMDRLHRITQQRTVQIDFVLAKNSIDAEIISAITTKKQVSSKMLGD